ncbi:type VI secretion system tip protein VgrG [Escherichia coli]|uniref:type VI secretion system tip protein VgrG n=1 Tax=Escherichia coli TaxID=562 RepID=UPI003EBE3988
MSTGLRFTLEVDGLPPDAFAVVSFHLTQSLSSLFSLDLSLVSQQFLSLEFAQVLDKMAYLTVWQGDDVQRRVKGVVTWFELGENDKNQMLYSMKVCPPLWRTGLRQNFRIFQNEDIESILATILKENGVTEWSPLFSEPHPSREFCVQYGETDYDFLCRMAAEEGIFFYEEHAQKSTDQSLVLCDSNTQVRAFTYDAQHPGRMVAHRYAGRPEMCYRYDDAGRVVEQLNPAGLSYRYQYEQDRITVTDSLNRREVLHTEGGAGLKRVVKKELADGSVTHSGYDAAGRLTAQTDAAGRRTEYGLNVVSGDITDITTPDGRETKFYYNDGNQLTAVVYPDGLESSRAYDEWDRLVFKAGLRRKMRKAAMDRNYLASVLAGSGLS